MADKASFSIGDKIIDCPTMSGTVEPSRML